jgi:hypothetical protein
MLSISSIFLLFSHPDLVLCKCKVQQASEIMAKITRSKRAVSTPALCESKTRTRKQPERYGGAAVAATPSKVTKEKPIGGKLKGRKPRVMFLLIKTHTRKASTGFEAMPEVATNPGEALIFLNADIRNDGSSTYWTPFFTGVANIRWAWFLWRSRYFLRMDDFYKDQEGFPIIVTGPVTRDIQRTC